MCPYPPLSGLWLGTICRVAVVVGVVVVVVVVVMMVVVLVGVGVKTEQKCITA